MVKYNFKIYKVQNSSKLGITYGIVVLYKIMIKYGI